MMFCKFGKFVMLQKLIHRQIIKLAELVKLAKQCQTK